MPCMPLVHRPRSARAPATPARPSSITDGVHLTYSPPRPTSSPAPPLRHLAQFLGTESSGSDAAAAAAMADVAAADGARSPTSRRQPRLDDACDHAHHQDVVMLRRTRSGRAFPPSISVIGRSGRPWLRLRASREGGRLVLREMRLPSQELLQPCKEDGRFKLLIHKEAGGWCGGGTAGTEREG